MLFTSIAGVRGMTFLSLELATRAVEGPAMKSAPSLSPVPKIEYTRRMAGESSYRVLRAFSALMAFLALTFSWSDVMLELRQVRL